jgi:hypothetical protein
MLPTECRTPSAEHRIFVCGTVAATILVFYGYSGYIPAAQSLGDMHVFPQAITALPFMSALPLATSLSSLVFSSFMWPKALCFNTFLMLPAAFCMLMLLYLLSASWLAVQEKCTTQTFSAAAECTTAYHCYIIFTVGAVLDVLLLLAFLFPITCARRNEIKNRLEQTRIIDIANVLV